MVCICFFSQTNSMPELQSDEFEKKFILDLQKIIDDNYNNIKKNKDGLDLDALDLIVPNAGNSTIITPVQEKDILISATQEIEQSHYTVEDSEFCNSIIKELPYTPEFYYRKIIISHEAKAQNVSVSNFVVKKPY